MNLDNLKFFLAKLEKRLYDLCKQHATGKLTTEINLTQGGIGESDIEISWKEKLK